MHPTIRYQLARTGSLATMPKPGATRWPAPPAAGARGDLHDRTHGG